MGNWRNQQLDPVISPDGRHNDDDRPVFARFVPSLVGFV